MNEPPHEVVDNPFNAGRRETRKRALIGAVVLVAAIAATAFIVWWRDPNRAIEKSRPLLDGLRAQYCKVYEKEAARPEGVVHAPSGAAPVRGLGYYFLDMKVWEHDEHADENMDRIELGELETLCKGTPGKKSIEFSSQLVTLLAPSAGDGARLDTMQKLLVAMGRVKYLFVARVSSFVASTAVGQTGLAPGRYAGTAAVYKLEDASLVAAAAVDERAPGFATIWGRQSAYGGIVKEDVQGSLSARTSLAFQEAFEHAFVDQGLALKIR